MSCFPCFTSQKSKKSPSKKEQGASPPENTPTIPEGKKQRPDEVTQVDATNIQAQTYTFRELATATKNFRQECLLAESGFGRVYKGTIPTTGKVVAVKQLDRNGMQGNKEFLAEVLMLSLLHHENLVNLVGYCADGDQRLLVYDYIDGGTVEDRLLGCGPDKPPLDWYSRIKIAAGAAKGLEYLHDTANPPVIHREMKPSNILLDQDLNPKLSDFGHANSAGGEKGSTVPSRVVGTYGYCAPEYVRSGNLTSKSDVYSFGVILLELITGRRAVDTTKPNDEQNLVSWAQPLFRDPKRFPDMADPLLNKCFPEKDLNQAVAITAMCLQEEPAARPLISDVVVALSFLSVSPPEGMPVTLPVVPSQKSPPKEPTGKERDSSDDDDSGSSSDEDNESHYDSDSQEGKFKSSHKSSKKSKSVNKSSGSKSGSYSSNDGSAKPKGAKSSLKSKGKSGKKSRKSSRKSSRRVLSHKSSMESDGNVSSGRSSVGSDDESDISEGSGSSEDESVHSEHENMPFDHSLSRGSEEESVHSE